MLYSCKKQLCVKANHYLKWTKLLQCYCPNFSSERKENYKINLKKFPLKYIRNFGIIAHIDHGKSTLSDRLMELAGNLSKQNKNEQVLDKLQVERERGITVKAQTVSLFYEYKNQTYLLNLIDTPGHVDFSYEVNRSLVACQGVILLIDANQGVQAQTLANFNLAAKCGLTIVPALNKIDLKNAKPDMVSHQVTSWFDISNENILRVSAKLGTGVESILQAVIEKIPPPNGIPDGNFRALLYDSWYSRHDGVVCLIMVFDGSICVGEEIASSSGSSHVIKELGILYPQEVPVKELFAGQAGYFKANIKNPKTAKVGDTWFKKGTVVKPLPHIAESKPMVFAGIFASDQSKNQDLKKALEKLTLNDSSVHISLDSSAALGQGWRLGFLGVLHMEVFCQRLYQEFDTEVVVTAPGIPYKMKITGLNNIKKYGAEEIIVSNASEFPDPRIIAAYYEPMVLGTIITQEEYYSPILKMCMNRRGQQYSVKNLDDQTMVLQYKFPLSEVIIDFFNELKVISSGYASFDYEEIGYEESFLKKIDIHLNGKIVEELSLIAHASQVEKVGRNICNRLKDCIEPQLFQVAIQACVDGKVICRENIKALRKDVAAKLYGGDVTRRMKLIQRQKEGKKNMRMVGNVQIPKNIFIDILKR